MGKQNCWDAKKCGRERGGARSAELGICPAATDSRLTGLNGGLNGGRVCWVMTGTLCGGKVQGSFALKMGSCMSCDFYQQVTREEGASCAKSGDLLLKLASAQAGAGPAAAGHAAPAGQPGRPLGSRH
jgi:hypothetical protein